MVLKVQDWACCTGKLQGGGRAVLQACVLILQAGGRSKGYTQNMDKLLNIVGNYSQKWKIEFSGAKSLIIPLKRNISTTRKWSLGYKYINDHDKIEITINEENEAKYLGITLSKHKKDMFQTHRNQLRSKAIKERFKCYKPAISTTRPILYGSRIWDIYVNPKILHGIAAINFSKNTFEKIEYEQKAYIRMI
jgi:hypothetical protein